MCANSQSRHHTAVKTGAPPARATDEKKTACKEAVGVVTARDAGNRSFARTLRLY